MSWRSANFAAPSVLPQNFQGSQMAIDLRPAPSPSDSVHNSTDIPPIPWYAERNIEMHALIRHDQLIAFMREQGTLPPEVCDEIGDVYTNPGRWSGLDAWVTLKSLCTGAKIDWIEPDYVQQRDRLK